MSGFDKLEVVDLYKTKPNKLVKIKICYYWYTWEKRQYIQTTLSRNFGIQGERGQVVANWGEDIIVFQVEITGVYFYVSGYNPHRGHRIEHIGQQNSKFKSLCWQEG